MEQDTGALPRRSARLAVRTRPAVPPRPKRLSKRKNPAASSTTITVPVTTGVLPACPVQGAGEPLAAYLQRVQAFTDAVATAKAQEEAAEAERQRLASEAGAQAQQTAEADAMVRDKRNAICMESLTMNESQWMTLLQGMLFVPSDTQADPTTAEEERSNLANLMLNMMRAIMWNNTMLMVQIHEGRQLRQIQQNDSAALTTAIRVAATHQQQQQQLLNTTTAHVNNIEAKASAAPGCTTDETRQLNGRIDHVVNLIGDIGVFNGPDTLSSTVAAIKTDITKLQTRPDAATKTYKMPHFDISKFDDYNKSDALTWWQRFLTEASCRTVPADDMMKALYLQLIGGAQAWMNHLAATNNCTIAELHTHITWKEFEKLWFTRFMVRNVVKAAMNEVYTCSQGNMPTRDWTTKWQKIVTTPGFDLSFTNQRSEFFSRSCAGLRTALGNEYHYASFQAILDRANLLIQTDDKAANERQSQPHYVAKQGFQRPAHNNAVISEETVDLHAAAAFSSDGGFVAALPPKRPKRVRKNKATQETTSTGTGQQPWTAYKITKDVYDLRQKYGYCLWCNGVTHLTAQCPEKGKARIFVLLPDEENRGTIWRATRANPALVEKVIELCAKHLEFLFAHAVDTSTRRDGARLESDPVTYGPIRNRSGGNLEDVSILVQEMRYGHFEWFVMPFGLTNAPATFQAAMTTEFRDLLDRSVLIYLDDILVYSWTLDEHIVHLRTVLDRFRLAQYKANLDKCEFAKQELEYLGYFVTPKGIRPLADKIQAIVDWPEPRCTTDVRSFMGLAGYYQRFVESYSKVVAPLSINHRNKGRSRVPFGELKPLPISRAPRLSIAMDVTGPFPRDRHGHDGILTVVDRLSKYAHFLPCKYHAAAPELARLLHTGWITNQGVPEDIVSDRDTRFMSTFWFSPMAESGTTMKPSSARHPQTDGQTERAHHTAQMMLRTLIRPDQKDWVDRFPDIEFAYNTSVHPAICVTPFELHHGGEKARIFADLLLPQAADIDVPCSPASVRKYRDLLIKARANMQKAQIRMQQQANRRRLPCPFREGDLVWVLSEEFALEQDVSRKLLPKWFGPWEVTSAVGDDPASPSFVINVPPHLTVHRVFHASKLAIYTPPSADEFPGRRSQDPPSMDGHQEVDRVITHRKYGNKLMQYKNQFVGNGKHPYNCKEKNLPEQIYDPRHRPWYKEASSPKKQVSVLVDLSNAIGAGVANGGADVVRPRIKVIKYTLQELAKTFKDDDEVFITTFPPCKVSEQV
ncbi:hypothetical protein CBR_g48833 [Chara braunii]|uniref:Integrase catalytic domain-containing protein n=1 Tax=Chara braunii TaxID=69332 RepID=A0A388M3H4_CHABU|nr:hypothetical protein CBR_g48833 [Chara braunii]|eukprot:GBG89124.1 hypothetical protein CBR_g48833 [Chara braunii]